MSRKSAHLQRHSDNIARDGSMPWKEHTDIFRFAVSNVLGRMFLYEFLEQLTQMTDKDHHEVCRKPESRMAGKKLYSDTHDDCFGEESAHTTATQGHSNPHPDITTSSTRSQRKAMHNVLFDLGNSSNEDSIKSGRILSKGFDEETKRTGMLLAHSSSPKYKAYISLKRHHDRIHVIDLPAAQELIVFFEAAHDTVLC